MTIFNWTKSSMAQREAANRLYGVALKQARQPYFFDQMGVPDTMDGRFEMVSLHVFLIMRRLGPGQGKLAQRLFDVMFKNMEMACREMGIGDLSVPKHIKRMMKAYKGRAFAYQNALENKGLNEAIARNVYGTAQNISPQIIEKMAAYVRACDKNMREQDVVKGQVSFVTLEDGHVSQAA